MKTLFLVSPPPRLRSTAPRPSPLPCRCIAVLGFVLFVLFLFFFSPYFPILLWFALCFSPCVCFCVFSMRVCFFYSRSLIFLFHFGEMADGGDDQLVICFSCVGPQGHRLGGRLDELQGPLRQAFGGERNLIHICHTYTPGKDKS